MGDRVLKLASFGVDTTMMVRCDGFTTSSSIVTTRPVGARAAPLCTNAARRMGFIVRTAGLMI